MSPLNCREQSCELLDFQTFPNQTVAAHNKFVVCLQPIFLQSLLRVIFVVRYQDLSHLQICIVDTVRDQWNDEWLQELQFIDIPEVNHFFGVHEGPGGQMLVRLSESGKEVIHIYDCPQCSLLGLQELTCIGKIDLSEIPYFHQVYPITCKFDDNLNLVYCSYFISSYLEFSSMKYEDLNVVKCRRMLDIADEQPSDETNAKFHYDIVSFPPSRYMSPQEITDEWYPIFIKNLCYLPHAQIPKSFCILKAKKEDGGYKHKIQIMTLPNSMK